MDLARFVSFILRETVQHLAARVKQLMTRATTICAQFDSGRVRYQFWATD
jgi:hypothetical protein